MNVFPKGLLYLLIFSILHMGYDLTHWAFLVPFCGINESVFQHLKMAFWAYLLTSLIEYLIMRSKLSTKTNFWYPRLLSAVMLPWVIMLIWYLIPAVFGKIGFLFEILWSCFVTYISGVIGGIIEKDAEKHTFTLNSKVTILILIAISTFLYIRFTYKPPWIDLFINPDVL